MFSICKKPYVDIFFTKMSQKVKKNVTNFDFNRKDSTHFKNIHIYAKAFRIPLQGAIQTLDEI